MKTEQSPLLHLSTLGGKMEGIPSLSTSTIQNKNCQKNRKVKNSICGHCYAYNATRYRSSLESNLVENMGHLSGGIIPDAMLPRTGTIYFRLESHGDLVNDVHLRNLIRIAELNPRTVFTLFTKHYSIPERVFNTVKKPKNLILVYSSLIMGKPMDIDKFKFADKIFTVYPKGTPGMNCSQACMSCRACYEPGNRTRYIKEEIHN